MTRSPLTQRAQALTLSHRGTNARQDDRRPPVQIMGFAYCLGHDFRNRGEKEGICASSLEGHHLRRLGGRNFSVDESWRWVALACANRVLGEA